MAATPPAAARPSALSRVRAGLAAFSAHPPRALRWAMLGAALVILIAVPLMALTGPQDAASNENTADGQLDAETTADITPVRPAGSTSATAGAPEPTSATTDVQPGASDPAGQSPAAGSDWSTGDTSTSSDDAASGGWTPPVGDTSSGSGGSSSDGGSTGGGSTQGTQAGSDGGTAEQPPVAGGQQTQTPPPAAATTKATTTAKPAPTTTAAPAPAPAPPTEKCVINVLGVRVCVPI